jgi:hypothetical protein
MFLHKNKGIFTLFLTWQVSTILINFRYKGFKKDVISTHDIKQFHSPKGFRTFDRWIMDGYFEDLLQILLIKNNKDRRITPKELG